MNIAKRVYYHSYFKRYKGNLGKTWKLINKTIKSKQIDEVPNEFKIGDKLIDDPKTIANGFNSYFCNVGKKYALSDKKEQNTICYLTEKAKTSFTFKPIDDKLIT